MKLVSKRIIVGKDLGGFWVCQSDFGTSGTQLAYSSASANGPCTQFRLKIAPTDTSITYKTHFPHPLVNAFQ